MSKKSAAKKSPRKQPAAAAPVDPRSAAIAASWQDKKVSAARLTRNKVRVGRKVFSSTRAAWKALELPPGACIGFRGKLKAAGKLAYTAPDGRQTTFTIVAD
jgi:hypothetical protein